MVIDFLLDRFQENRLNEAIVWSNTGFSYEWLLDAISKWNSKLEKEGIGKGRVVLLEADFSPNATALLLALIIRETIIVPLSVAPELNREKFIEIAEAEIAIKVNVSDAVEISRTGKKALHVYYETLRRDGHPGLVLFSSGSTGKSKAAVHDFHKLLNKFRTRRHNLRTAAFLMFDHIGGIDTLLYSLSNVSCLVTLSGRSPDDICAAIEKYRVEVLPVSPTFLNLLILSEAYIRYDLASLKYITYGTEVMPEATLKKCSVIFPNATILQKYGTTEVGTLRSKSENSSSLWVKIGGEGYRIRVVNGLLQIKADSAMMGYLNEQSPFTEDGWFITGDLVQQKGEFVRFLGRESDVINVGGEKVNPAEVENVIREFENIAEAEVYGEKNPIVGNIICARVKLQFSTDADDFVLRLKKHCLGRLPNFKVPVKIAVVSDWNYSERFKTIRKPSVQEK